MNESLEDLEKISEAPAATSVGGLLASARESAGLTIEEVAAQLRISLRQVVALEGDDIAALPAPTFVRGFIRNYAKLLNLDATELLQTYPVAAPESARNTITLQSENIPIVSQYKKGWVPYVMASAFVGVALAGWMAYMEYMPNSGAKLLPEKVTEAVTPVSPAPVEPIAPTQPVIAATEPVPVAIPVESAPQQPPVQPVVNDTAKLTLTFNQQSWVSVTDRDGKELLSKSQPAGSQSAIEGASPFNVVIGNASGVQVSYNDKSVDLTPYTKSNVARLTLE